jgi:hypothetical protein
MFITFRFPQILRRPTNPKLGLDPIFKLKEGQDAISKERRIIDDIFLYCLEII